MSFRKNHGSTRVPKGCIMMLGGYTGESHGCHSAATDEPLALLETNNLLIAGIIKLIDPKIMPLFNELM